MVGEILYPLALVVSVWLLCRAFAASSRDWAEAWRFYAKARGGLIVAPPEELEEDGRTPGQRHADDLFEAWHDAVQWGSEEQAHHVRTLWKTAFRSGAKQREKSEALRELIALGAPIPQA